MGKGGDSSVGKVGLGVASDGVKRRRVSCKQINKAWQAFLEIIHQNKGGRRSTVVRVESPTKVYSRVYCPFGNGVGGGHCSKCFENMLLQRPGKFERRKLLNHLRKKHPEIAVSYGVELKQADVCDDGTKKPSARKKPSDAEVPSKTEKPSVAKCSLGTKANKKEKESDAEGEDDIIIIGSYDD